jgi:hypothetical protein
MYLHLQGQAVQEERRPVPEDECGTIFLKVCNYSPNDKTRVLSRAYSVVARRGHHNELGFHKDRASLDQLRHFKRRNVVRGDSHGSENFDFVLLCFSGFWRSVGGYKMFRDNIYINEFYPEQRDSRLCQNLDSYLASHATE